VSAPSLAQNYIFIDKLTKSVLLLLCSVQRWGVGWAILRAALNV
jgi:hypothetical protein